MSVIKVDTFFLKVVMGYTLDTIIFTFSTYLFLVAIVVIFAYRLYSSLLVKMLKIGFSHKTLNRFFFEILDLSSSNTRQKYF